MRGKTILAVDDDEMILELIKIVVEDAKGTFIGADGAGACLIALERTQPDLLIFDIKMQGLDGLELLARIREQFPKLKSKVVFLTAQKSGDAIDRGEELGCDGFILKPIDPRRLADRIREMFVPTTYPE